MRIKRILSFIITISLVLTIIVAFPMDSNADLGINLLNPFKDINTTHWYYTAVRTVYNKGFMGGTSKNTFDPELNLTRAMLATILAKVADANLALYPQESIFDDVKANQWYTTPIEWARMNNYVAGYGTTFGHNDNITREQLVLILYKFAQRNSYITNNINDSVLNKYTDRNQIHTDWDGMEQAFKWAITNNIISGTTETTLSPLSNATRAQVAVIICNFIKLYAAHPDLSIRISGNDISQYKIIYGKNTNKSEVYAAKQLQEYIYKTNGVTLPLYDDSTPSSDKEIIVGSTNREGSTYTINRGSYGEEGFVIKVVNSKLIIAGGRVRGTLYGVYEFLETYLGWRFYTPSVEVCRDLGSVIDIPAGLNNEQIPTFEFRDVNAAHYTLSDISAKRKLNGAFHRNLEEEQGGNIKFVGGDQYFSHTLNLLANRSGLLSNICLTNDANLTTVTNNALDMLSKSHSNILAVTQMDTYDWCNCTTCLAQRSAYQGNYASYLLNFVNKVAKKVKAQYPDRRILTLAYFNTFQPSTIVPEDNVIIEFAPIDAYGTNSIFASSNAETLDALNGWSKLCTNDNLYIWDYPAAQEDLIAPYPNFYPLYENVTYYAKIGVKGIFMQGVTYREVQSQSGRTIGYNFDGEFAELRAYLLAKLLWNPNMTLDEYNTLIDEFMQDFYGDGWESVREFLNIISEYGPKINITIWDNALVEMARCLGRKNIQNMQQLWDNAEANAKTNTQYSNVQRASMQYTAMKLYTEFIDITESGTEEEVAEMVALNEKFYNQILKYNVFPVQKYPDNYTKDTLPVITNFKKKSVVEVLGMDK